MVSEITPLLIITKLEQFDVPGATAIAVVMLVAAFVMLLAINGLQAWTRREARSMSADARATPRRRAAPRQRRDHRAGVGAARPDRRRARVPHRLPVRSADRRLRRGAEEGRRRLPRRDHRARRGVGDQADAARRRDLGAAQPRLRHRRRVVDRQVRLPRQEPAAHLHRPAVLGQPGDRRPDLRPRLRPAGLVRRMAARPRPEDHLRAARHRASRRSSSPSRSSPAS